MNKSKGCLDWLTQCLKNKKQEEDFNKTKQENQIITNFITPEKAIIKISNNNIDKDYKLESIQPEEILIKKVNLTNNEIQNNNYNKSKSRSSSQEKLKLDSEMSVCHNCKSRGRITYIFKCCNKGICQECDRNNPIERECIFCNKHLLEKTAVNYLPINQKDNIFMNPLDNRMIASIEKKTLKNGYSSKAKNETKKNDFKNNLRVLDLDNSIFKYDKRSKSFDNGEYYNNDESFVNIFLHTLQEHKKDDSSQNNQKIKLSETQNKIGKFFETVKLSSKTKQPSRKLISYNGKCGEIEIKEGNSKGSIDDMIQNNEEFFFERDSVEL